MDNKDLPSLPLALLPVVLTLGLLALQLFYYGDFTPHIPLILGLAITSLLGVFRGQTWMDIREGVFHVIHVSMPSLAVLTASPLWMAVSRTRSCWKSLPIPAWAPRFSVSRWIMPRTSRKPEILQALAHMLEANPGGKITTAKLAKEVGLSEAALYRHFPSKAKMIEGLIEFIEETLF